MTMPPIAMIAAVARNNVIGRDNQLLWRLRTDLRRFRALTLGKPLIMGRKTFESIGKALPGRYCIVLTRQRSFKADGVRAAHSLEAAIEIAQGLAAEHGASEIMIGGGAEIYAAAMPLAGRLYLTHVDLEPDGDAVFPPVDPALWKRVRQESHRPGAEDEAAFTFADYARKPARR